MVIALWGGGGGGGGGKRVNLFPLSPCMWIQ